MPFDTLGRCSKRLRNGHGDFLDDLSSINNLWSFPTVEPFLHRSSKPEPIVFSPRLTNNLISTLHTPFEPTVRGIKTTTTAIRRKENEPETQNYRDNENSFYQTTQQQEPQCSAYLHSPSLSSCSSTSATLPASPVGYTEQQQQQQHPLHQVNQHQQQQQQQLCSSMLLHPSMSITPTLDLETIHAALSRFRLSFTDTGINMEANISTASDFRTLLEAFGKLSCTTPTSVAHDVPWSDNNSSSCSNDNGCDNDTDMDRRTPSRRNSVVLYRNKSCKSVPVNYMQMVGLLGQILQPHSRHHGIMTLRQIADSCVDAYFSCWVRYTPVLQRQDFMKWYLQQEAPQDTLIVNALCSLIFRHAVTHHCAPGLQHFLHDPDMVHQQEEFYFNRARDALAQSFDTPDRFTVIALTFLCARAEPSRRQHYGGLAVSLLQQLHIYPRMLTPTSGNSNHNDFSTLMTFDHHDNQGDNDDDVDDGNEDDDNVNDENDDAAYALEMDTRLWWFVWQIDFAHWTAGLPKITPLLQLPNQRYEHVDFPMVFEQDIDEAEIAVLAQLHTLTLWRIQSDIISTMYEQDSELTSEQLADFDIRLTDFYQRIPTCLQWTSATTTTGLNSSSHTNQQHANDMKSGAYYDNQQHSVDMALARTRIKLEYNASRIILHRLFTPDVDDALPSPTALSSLNLCLLVALEQLDILGNCIQSDTRCAFDLFELWRVGRILSMAIDIHRTIKDHRIMMQGLTTYRGDDSLLFLQRQLQRTISVLEATPEGMIGTKSWIEVANFLTTEMKRHTQPAVTIAPTPKATPSSAVKRSACIKLLPSSSNLLKTTTMTTQQQLGKKPLTGLLSPSLSIISFASPTTPSTSSLLALSSKSPASSTSTPAVAATTPSSQSSSSSSTCKRRASNSRPRKQSTSSTSSTKRSSPPTQTFVQATCTTFDGKNQPRFRYFNPRKMNKFLFIDESR